MAQRRKLLLYVCESLNQSPQDPRKARRDDSVLTPQGPYDEMAAETEFPKAPRPASRVYAGPQQGPRLKVEGED